MTTSTRQRAERLLLEARLNVRAAQAVLRTVAHLPTHTQAPAQAAAQAPAAPPTPEAAHDHR